MSLLCLAGSRVYSQAPEVKMVPIGTNFDEVAVYLEWPANPAATGMRVTNNSRISLWYDEDLGTITKTDVQGTWNLGNSFDAATVAGGMGSNPDNLAFIDYTINGPTDFGNVSTAGTIDTIYKLKFSNPTAGATVRMLQAVNGVGPTGFDSTMTVNGFIPNITMRPNPSTIFTSYNLTQSSDTIPLPVKLLSFDARWTSETEALVYWSTATEINNQHFEVERSLDGTFFEKIGVVKSAAPNGNSNQILQYSFQDKNLHGINQVFYRLKQVDFDESHEYHRIAILDRTIDGVQIEVFPTVVTYELKFKINDASNLLLVHDPIISIQNTLGQPVKIVDIQTQIKSGNTYTVNTSDLSHGMYYLKIDVPRQASQMLPFVKQD